MSPTAFDPASCQAIPPNAFDKQGRLAAMLSVHAHAYFGARQALPAALPSGTMQIDAAALFLRCDRDGLSVSRRRRATAKLAAYGWETGEFVSQLLVLGLNVDRFREAVLTDIPPHVLVMAGHNHSLLEYFFAQLLRQHPALMADSDNDPCDDQPEAPYDPPFGNDTPSQISIETYVSVKMPAASVYQNLDPQRWDECSAFWPTPNGSMTAPLSSTYGSTYIATESSPDCTLTASEIVPDTSPPTAGTTYPGKFFFEHFACTTAPCDAEFENLLSITVEEGTHDVYNVGSFWTHRVDYGFPACPANGGFDRFDGYIWSRFDGQKPPPKVVLDEGTMDVWEHTDAQTGTKRTHVRGHKLVKFDNPVINGSTGVALGFTELNEELAEVACCLKQGGGP
jgi:hypothetical protein